MVVVMVLVIAGLAILAYLELTGRLQLRTGDPDGTTPPPNDVVFVGAGDIAECPTEGDEATAAVLDAVVAEHPDAVVFTTGDNAYQDGSYQEFLDCYDPSWGRHKERTRPAVGNNIPHSIKKHE